jgi:D-tyrosyl-tRNA(Tyr) deacylase
MKVVIQRAKRASVTIDEKIFSEIGEGLMVLVGIEDADFEEDVKWLANKIVQLRIFNDENGVMNLSLCDIKGDLLIVSQFTLHASTKKGNRPSYIKASKPDHAVPIYQSFVNELSTLIGKPVKTGQFGADMKVELINDGPVTIVMDTKNKE